MVRMPPPPTATITEPTTAAKIAYHSPVTIRGAIWSWSRAAKAAKTKIAIPAPRASSWPPRSEEHTSELQSRGHLVCRLLLEKKKGLMKVRWFSNYSNETLTQQ